MPGWRCARWPPAPKLDFLIQGSLDVNGASGSEVVLTSDAAVPAAGDWSGVRLVTGSTGTLDWATVSWADNGVYATGAGTTATLNRVTASDNTYGVFVYNNAAADADGGDGEPPTPTGCTSIGQRHAGRRLGR